MEIKITDNAIKEIGDNIMYIVKGYRNAPSMSTSSDIKGIVREMDNAIKEIIAGKINLTDYYSDMVGIIGRTLFTIGGRELFDKVLEYLENHPEDPEVKASVRFARALEEAPWNIDSFVKERSY
jgi:hypothetical protein